MYLLSVARLIACKDASLFEAFSCPWTPPLAFYKLLEIERPRFTPDLAENYEEPDCDIFCACTLALCEPRKCAFTPDFSRGYASRQSRNQLIVMTWVADPLGSGFVASLAHPGGNITGTSLMHSEVVVKRLELLRALLPSLSAWPSWPMGVIPSIGSSSRKRWTPRSVWTWRCSW